MTKKTPKKDKADKEWADLQRELETLGEQLGSLRKYTGTLGKTVVANIDSHYEGVKSRVTTFRQAKEAQLNAARRTAVQQASATQQSLTEAGVSSTEKAKETARQVWERSEPLRHGAQEVGHGFARAWSEIAASFGKAAETIQTEKAARTPARAAAPARAPAAARRKAS